ncbi:MAG: hypothetical protein ABI723_05085 [Bacteroidia bacterium]
MKYGIVVVIVLLFSCNAPLTKNDRPNIPVDTLLPYKNEIKWQLYLLHYNSYCKALENRSQVNVYVPSMDLSFDTINQHDTAYWESNNMLRYLNPASDTLVFNPRFVHSNGQHCIECSYDMGGSWLPFSVLFIKSKNRIFEVHVYACDKITYLYEDEQKAIEKHLPSIIDTLKSHSTILNKWLLEELKKRKYFKNPDLTYSTSYKNPTKRANTELPISQVIDTLNHLILLKEPETKLKNDLCLMSDTTNYRLISKYYEDGQNVPLKIILSKENKFETGRFRCKVLINDHSYFSQPDDFLIVKRNAVIYESLMFKKKYQYYLVNDIGPTIKMNSLFYKNNPFGIMVSYVLKEKFLDDYINFVSFSDYGELSHGSYYISEFLFSKKYGFLYFNLETGYNSYQYVIDKTNNMFFDRENVSWNKYKNMSPCEKLDILANHKDYGFFIDSIVTDMCRITKIPSSVNLGTAGMTYLSLDDYKNDIRKWKAALKCK